MTNTRLPLSHFSIKEVLNNQIMSPSSQNTKSLYASPHMLLIMRQPQELHKKQHRFWVRWKLRTKVFCCDSFMSCTFKQDKICVAGSLLACEARCRISMLASGDSFIFFTYLWIHLQNGSIIESWHVRSEWNLQNSLI